MSLISEIKSKIDNSNESQRSEVKWSVVKTENTNEYQRSEVKWSVVKRSEVKKRIVTNARSE